MPASRNVTSDPCSGRAGAVWLVRALAVEVYFGFAGPFLLISICLITGGRLCDGNLAILGATGASIAARGLPFVIAGDIQVQPQTLHAASVAPCLAAVVIAPDCPLGTRVRTASSEPPPNCRPRCTPR
jgi:hypothetical protein